MGTCQGSDSRAGDAWPRCPEGLHVAGLEGRAPASELSCPLFSSHVSFADPSLPVSFFSQRGDLPPQGKRGLLPTEWLWNVTGASVFSTVKWTHLLPVSSVRQDDTVTQRHFGSPTWGDHVMDTGTIIHS